MSISTGRVLNRLHATPLPMPDDVVDRIHRMARQQRGNPGLLFGNRRMNPMDEESVGSSDSEDDGDYMPDEEDHSEDNGDYMPDEEGHGEEAVSEHEHTDPNYDDDEEDDLSTGNRSNQLNEGSHDVGQPIGPGEEGTGTAPAGGESGMPDEYEQDEHIPTDLEAGPVENPGVMDQENEGVVQADQATSINKKQYDLLTEIDTNEDGTPDQNSEENKAMQGKPRYNLRKHRG